MVEVKVLGQFDLRLNGELITLSSRPAQSLLAYLILNAGVPQRREMLAGLLWPDSDEKNARSNLRHALWRVRKAIGPDYLVVDKVAITFDETAPYQLDAAAFQTQLADNASAEDLLAVVSLYEGELLPGFYDDWVVLEREHLRSIFEDRMGQLLEGLTTAARWREVRSWAERWIALGQVPEAAFRALMMAHAGLGDQAALDRVYQRCVMALDSGLGVEPSKETQDLYQQFARGQGLPPRSVSESLDSTPSLRSPSDHPTSRQDWGEAPDVSIFYGRQDEATQLRQWLVDDRCRLIGVLGMGGIGKTALVTWLAEQTKDEFEYVVWRSLRNAPPLDEILADWILFLSDQQAYDLEDSVDKRISLLIDYLRQNRCLLILDNVEAILQAGERAGDFRPGYEDYGHLFQRIGESRHQICLVLTSREKPRQFGPLEGKTAPVRSLQLANIDAEACQAILQDRGLAGSSQDWAALLNRYSGNPLALKLVAETVRELFFGDIAAFLAEESAIFGGVWELLAQHYNRLSAIEQELLIWLAIEREPVDAAQLQTNIAHSISRRQLLEALRNLHSRSLLEQTDKGFTLQNVVMEFLTDYLVDAVSQEIVNHQTKIEKLNQFALLKAQAKDYIRASQRRLILKPVADRLLDALGQVGLEAHLKVILDTLRTTGQPGYAGGNILNLLLSLNSNLRGYDFSGLTVWQADLAGQPVRDINLAGADLAGAAFMDTFGVIDPLAFSPDGKIIVAGVADGQIRMWNTTNGQPFLSWVGHSNWVRSVVFSPDGQILASGSRDHTINLWDMSKVLSASDDTALNTPRNPQKLLGHTGGVDSVAFSPDGQTLVSGGEDQTVRLWDVASGQCLKTMVGHTDIVKSVAFSPNGQIVASGSVDRTVRLWDIADSNSLDTGQAFKTLAGHTSRIWTVAFSPDGQILASGGEDQTVRLWDVASGRFLRTLTGHLDMIESVAFSPNGQIVASAGADRTVRLWDINTGQLLKTLTGHTKRLMTVAFSPDSQTMISGGHDYTVRLWDVSSGQCLKTLTGYSNWVQSVTFSPDGQTLASGSTDRTVRLWDVANISASTDNTVLDMDQKILLGHTDGVWSVVFSPDGETLASAGADRTVRFWNPANPRGMDTRRALKTLLDCSDVVVKMAFSPDGQLLATGGYDQTVCLWDVANAKGLGVSQPLKILRGHTNWIWSVALSPDGQILASGGEDRTIRLWDINTGQCLTILTGHTNTVGALDFSPDGQILASGSGDRTVCLWDIANPKGLDSDQPLKVLQGHSNNLWSVVFSPDGQILASSSFDQTVRLWDINSGECLETLTGHTNGVLTIAFSPDGRLLTSGSADGTIKFWDVANVLASRTRESFLTLQPDRPYERMNITGVIDLTEAQKITLKALGAVELD